ncbi:hypothetical protein AB5J72_39530 [Streptomyces sp. CG1]|uniref:hypothetical protein n=1 Tax=Streptomyces sp. CG1 TaxID=1287523 RepID=UPI0034E23997
MSLTDGKRMLLCDYRPDTDGVGYIDMAGARFTEPFFVQSVIARLQAVPRAVELAGDRRELMAGLDQPSRGLPLRGMIFHTGRCGSTLLANALSAIESIMILKEPLFLSSLSIAATGPDTDELADRTRSLFSHALVPTRPQQTDLVLKPSSWNVLGSDFWEAVTEGRPRVFVWRPCAEVMESMLESPAGWATGVEPFLPPSVLEAEQAATSAAARRGLSLPMRTAMAAWLATAARGAELGKAGALVIPYEAIRRDFRTVVVRVLHHLGIAVSPEVLQTAVSVANVYSKDPSGALPFTSVQPRAKLPNALREAIETAAHDIETALTALADPLDRHGERLR